MKNISPKGRTTNLPVTRHLILPLHHQIMSFTSLFFILSMSFLRGQDEKTLFQDSSHRHGSYETIVFATTSQSAIGIAHSVFLLYLNIFFEVVMKNISPKTRTIDLPLSKLSSSPLDHQLLPEEALFF